MLKKFLIVGTAFVLAGISVLLWLSYRQTQWQKLRDDYSAKYSAAGRNFLQNWFDLPADACTPALQQNDAANQSAEQISRVQNERFIADIDKLNDIESHLYPVANLLYGSNWRQKLQKFNQTEAITKNISAGAIVSCTLGSALILSSLFGLTAARIHKYKNKSYYHKTKNKPVEQLKTNETVKPRPSVSEILNLRSNNIDNTAHNFEQNREAEDIFVSSYQTVKKVKTEIDQKAKQFKKEVKAAKRIEDKQPDLLSDTLSRLAEEVAAIRGYAGKQEETVKKFQDGYSWNVIRNFALRVIRCIDNLEKRIEALAEMGQSTEHLLEIRDELLFAIESTGLERFEPQLNSDYRGQEKSAEAVKDKTSAQNDQLKGKIADVIRCGYRYMLDDDNYKIVRTAQVRLFG
ncbi:MAG: hypothetical protein WC374_04455 [Phycisphaerae bacterium]|jgi:molecular chaperone GrpE (heat shock protein)